MNEPAPIRLSLTLPGCASLGAYQAGAVAALTVAIQELRRQQRPVVVDAVGGASSGALVAFLTAQCLLEGLDPHAVLHRAWVDWATLALLRGGKRAPLSYRSLRRQLGDIIDPHDEQGRPTHRVEGRQSSPLALHVNLANLEGLSYLVGGVAGHEIVATTYVDWSTFELQPGAGVAQLVEPRGRSPLDHVLASAANPLGFAPRMLDRTGDQAIYRDNGIQDFPASGRLWYTDGGLLSSEPVGRTLAAAREVAGAVGNSRLHLVIDPRGGGPSGSSRWSDPSQPPSWISGLGRAMTILPVQALYDDLRRIAAVNNRIEAINTLADHLGPALGDEAKTALRDAVTASVEIGEDASGAEVVRRALSRLAGLEGKEHVQAELISPLLLVEESGRGVPDLLAGERFVTFGGFFSRRYRHSDYTLGWASTRSWLPRGLRRAGVDDAGADAATEAVDGRGVDDWRSVNVGRPEDSRLRLAERASLAGLAVGAGRVLGRDALHLVADRPGRRRRRKRTTKSAS